ncbi:unnamed protein product, partial [Protopolystoma xenopodis]
MAIRRAATRNRLNTTVNNIFLHSHRFSLKRYKLIPRKIKSSLTDFDGETLAINFNNEHQSKGGRSVDSQQYNSGADEMLSHVVNRELRMHRKRKEEKKKARQLIEAGPSLSMLDSCQESEPHPLVALSHRNSTVRRKLSAPALWPKRFLRDHQLKIGSVYNLNNTQGLDLEEKPEISTPLQIFPTTEVISSEQSREKALSAALRDFEWITVNPTSEMEADGNYEPNDLNDMLSSHVCQSLGYDKKSQMHENKLDENINEELINRVGVDGSGSFRESMQSMPAHLPDADDLAKIRAKMPQDKKDDQLRHYLRKLAPSYDLQTRSMRNSIPSRNSSSRAHSNTLWSYDLAKYDNRQMSRNNKRERSCSQASNLENQRSSALLSRSSKSRGSMPRTLEIGKYERNYNMKDDQSDQDVSKTLQAETSSMMDQKQRPSDHHKSSLPRGRASLPKVDANKGSKDNVNSHSFRTDNLSVPNAGAEVRRGSNSLANNKPKGLGGSTKEGVSSEPQNRIPPETEENRVQNASPQVPNDDLAKGLPSGNDEVSVKLAAGPTASVANNGKGLDGEARGLNVGVKTLKSAYPRPSNKTPSEAESNKKSTFNQRAASATILMQDVKTGPRPASEKESDQLRPYLTSGRVKAEVTNASIVPFMPNHLSPNFKPTSDLDPFNRSVYPLGHVHIKQQFTMLPRSRNPMVNTAIGAICRRVRISFHQSASTPSSIGHETGGNFNKCLNISSPQIRLDSHKMALPSLSQQPYLNGEDWRATEVSSQGPINMQMSLKTGVNGNELVEQEYEQQNVLIQTLVCTKCSTISQRCMSEHITPGWNTAKHGMCDQHQWVPMHISTDGAKQVTDDFSQLDAHIPAVKYYNETQAVQKPTPVKGPEEDLPKWQEIMQCEEKEPIKQQEPKMPQESIRLSGPINVPESIGQLESMQQQEPVEQQELVKQEGINKKSITSQREHENPEETMRTEFGEMGEHWQNNELEEFGEQYLKSEDRIQEESRSSTKDTQDMYEKTSIGDPMLNRDIKEEQAEANLEELSRAETAQTDQTSRASTAVNSMEQKKESIEIEESEEKVDPDREGDNTTVLE